MTALSERAIARHVRAQIRSSWREKGWNVFTSDKGRFWATTTRRPLTQPASHWAPRHTVLGVDAVDADTYTELAAKLEAR